MQKGEDGHTHEWDDAVTAEGTPVSLAQMRGREVQAGPGQRDAFGADRGLRAGPLAGPKRRVDQPGDETDGAHLSHKGRVEADLIDAVYDLRRRLWYFEPFGRVDVNDNDVTRFASVDQRKQCRIAHIPAIPKILPVDFNRLAE